MKILLINICIRFDSPIKHIPVGLSSIATTLKYNGFNFDILDLDLYRLDYFQITDFLKNKDYDIVGMGTIVTGYKFVKTISKLIRQLIPHAIIIVGNTVASSIPENLMIWVPEIDFLVLGEGEKTIVELLKAIYLNINYDMINGIVFRKNNEIIYTKSRNAIELIDTIPFPDYSIFEVDKYLDCSYLAIPEPSPLPLKEMRALPLSTTRGCLYRCSFCYNTYQKYKYRRYSTYLVVNQIKNMIKEFKINYIHFWDDLTFSSVTEIEEFCNEIEKCNIHFFWNIATRGDLFRRNDRELLLLCKELGAISVSGSLESADSNILKAMNKKLILSDFIEQVETVSSVGLVHRTSLVFGYPEESKETIKKTISVCRDLSIYPSSGFILPLPKTPIYKYAMQKGLITNEEDYLLNIGDRQDLHINLTSMPNEGLIDTVNNELIKLKDYLGVAISDEQVLKTTTYRMANKVYAKD